MFDTIADMLRGSAPDDLAHALGTDRTQTRRAMEIGLPALITGLRDKTLEPGGAQNLAAMLDEPTAAVPEDLDAYLAAGDPAQGASMLDVAFGDRGEPALASLSTASGLSTRLLAQVMSVLAPLATGVVAATAERSPEGLRSYLAGAVEDLEGKGFGRVVELVSPELPLGADFAPDLDAPANFDESASALDDGLGDDGLGDDGLIDTGMSSAGLIDAGLGDDGLGDAGLGDAGLGDAGLGDEGLGDNVVAGAFPDLDDAVVLDDGGFDDSLTIDASLDETLAVGDATEAIDFTDDVPSFGSDLASVAPAGAAVAASNDLGGPGLALAEPPRPADGIEVDADVDSDGKAMSSMGWLWWLVAAVLFILVLFFAISRCGGSDGADIATDGTDAVAAATATPDPLVLQRQATLDSILVDYPGVTGEVVGEVAVLEGTVSTETDRALLDKAVRDAGLGAQNLVTAQEVPANDGVPGYSLNDLIDAQPELSTLRSLLDQAGLGEALDGGGEFTLFAPTNEAFAAISDQLGNLQNDPQGLQDVLRYHLLVGAQDSTVISASPNLATQLEGQTIAVSAADGLVRLNDDATVIRADAPARNGVMHIVDRVLLPATAMTLPEELGAALNLAPITFASGGSDITDAGLVELDKVVEFLLATPGNIEIGGHTDSDGGDDLNLSLSQDRADAVKAYLESQGIPSDSMTAVGFGEGSPIAANDTPENKAMNRRIEFRPS